MKLLKKLLDLFEPTVAAAVDPDADASERWRRFNAQKRAAGCPCGRPATRRRVMLGAAGGVMPEIWSCDECYGAEGHSGPRGEAKPFWGRIRSCGGCDLNGSGLKQCHGYSSDADGGRRVWLCPDKPPPDEAYHNPWILG